MNLCAILINSKDHTSELSEIFNLDDGVFECYDENIIKIYKISSQELENMSLEEIVIDRITKLTVDY